MQRVTLAKTDLAVSRFIFGTASLFNAGRTPARRRLLEAAVEAGFTHFDTAPYYGFGQAERDLAPVLRSNPDLTVTTKVGIWSPGGENQGEASIFLRKAAGRLIPALSRPTIDFAVARAGAALEGSLRRLGRERIDCYLLHEPEPHLIATDEWQGWLEACQASGKVGEFGLAATPDRIAGFLKAGVNLGRVIQLPDSLTEHEADLLGQFGWPLQITYGYLSAAARQGAFDVAEVLGEALRRNAAGAIIVSTRRPERCATFARIAAG